MKTIKKTTFSLLMILGILGMASMSSCSSKNDIPNPTTNLVLNVKVPGTLSQEIRKMGIDSLDIQKIKLTGTLNSADVLCLRHMTGSGKSKEVITNGKLADLDISKVKFIKDTTVYFVDSDLGTKGASIDNPNSLPNFMFAYCPVLKNINLPTGIKSIGQASFMFSFRLTNIDIPSNITSIKNVAFSRCPSITDINIPEKVASIGDFAFSSCSSLKSIKIPEDIKLIGKNAFSDNKSLKDVTMFTFNPLNIKLETNIFDQIKNDAILHVRAKAIEKYEKIDQFKKAFKGGIIEIR